MFFLPEAHTDFIFALIGEELGLIGALLVLALFAVVAVRGFRVAARHPDSFASLLAFGLTAVLFLEAVVNVGVVLGLLPTKGLAAAVPELRWLGAAGDDARGRHARRAVAHDGLRMRMIVAGGGTGGHLFPGLAVAEQRGAAPSRSRVLFVGSAFGIEARVIPRTRFAVPRAAHPRPARPRLARRAAARRRSCRGRSLHAWRILGEFGADVVLGVGGYASFPVVVAAWLRRVPSVLLEQNAHPGLANRVLGRLARRVCTTFAEANAYFPGRQGRC